MRNRTWIIFIIFLLLSCSSNSAQNDTRNWGIPEAIGDPMGHISSADVVITPDNKAVVIWDQYDNSEISRCYSNTYSPETGWAAADTFDTDLDMTKGGYFGYRLAINQTGDLFLAWVSLFLDSHFGYYAKRYDHITGWVSSELIDQLEPGMTGSAPTLYMDHDNTVVFWLCSHEGTWHIYYKRFTPTTGWQTTQLLTSGSSTDDPTNELQSFPRMFFNSEGEAFAVWMTNEENSLNLWSSSFVPEYGFGSPELIFQADSDGFGGWGSDPVFDSDQDGNAVVVWGKGDGTSQSIWASRYTPGQGWGPAELIDSNENGYSYYPTLKFNEYGMAIALWHHLEDGYWSVYSNTCTTQNGWGTPVLLRISEEGISYSGVPKLVCDSHGNAFSAWEQLSEGVRRIWASKYTYRIGWSEPELIDDPDTKESIALKIAIDTSGNVTSIWRQSDGSHSIMMANRYE